MISRYHPTSTAMQSQDKALVLTESHPTLSTYLFQKRYSETASIDLSRNLPA
ncbi:protein of unknown function [Tepidibacter aestuarii]|nr:protein of unknown function [Tepidibacter aestuarii]